MKTAFMLILKFYHKIKLNSALLAGVFFIAQLSLCFCRILWRIPYRYKGRITGSPESSIPFTIMKREACMIRMQP